MNSVLKTIFQILFTLSLICLLSACGSDEQSKIPTPVPAIPVKVVKVTKSDLPLTKEFIGQTKGAIDAEVRARVEGVVTSINFEEGKEVSEGQLLYTIDPAPFKAKVAEVQGKLAEAKTKLVKAESDLSRVKPLVEMKALSAKDLDAAIAQEGSAQGVVDAATAALEAANIELGYCEIKAPTSGIIGITKAKVGEFVGRPPNPSILNTVSKLDPIHVMFSVTEQEYLYFARLKMKEEAAGQVAQKKPLQLVLADGSAWPESGLVASVGREIDTKTGTLAVEAAFPNANKLLRPGQYAKIKVVAETVSGALMIPKRAIRDMQGQSQVFVVKSDKTAEVKTITLGAEMGEFRVVERGLDEGELVVVDGIQKLRAGVLVSFE